MTELTARELLIMLYQTALDAVDGHYLVNQWCRNLTTADKPNTEAFSHCVAIGKAAPAMLSGVLNYSPAIKQSLLICPPAKLTRAHKKNNNVQCVTSSHPIPDETSLTAGDALIRFLDNLSAEDNLLFLISGGTSALVEVLAKGLSLEELQQINKYLLASGKDIHQVNAWRQRFSAIKGGGLLSRVKSASLTQLLLSDVKGDNAAFIGSGLLISSQTETDNDPFLCKFLDAIEQQNSADEIRDIEVDSHIIGNIKTAMMAVHDAAESEGLDSFIHEEFLEGEAEEVASKLFTELENAARGIHIWGGETTVSLPASPGVGGRNLTLALAFAKHLEATPDLHLLAAGTDGVDGNSNCAGAVVSMYTVKKAKGMGFDMQMELDKANAGILLMATDDLVRAEQSNTNVMDIVIAYKS